MTELVLDKVGKRFGSVDVIHEVDLTVRSGEFVVFVGPSGCGKSTLLRMIAGLEGISTGRLSIAGVDHTRSSPAERKVAMVFQNYALYPHMTARQNLSFGMRMNRRPRREIAERVAHAAELLRLEPLLDRKPAALSGGQNQRVAIGRAIVQEPGIFLFDEPLSNLDAELRAHMRLEIAALHGKLQSSMIYVTHDQVEAMTLAERIVVMRNGRIEQIGTPDALYKQPVNTFVASSFGSPTITILRGTVDEDGDVRLADGARLAVTSPTKPGGTVQLGIRPEHWRVDPAGPVAAQVIYLEHLGAVDHVYARHESGEIRFHTTPRHGLRPGDRVTLSASTADILLFKESGDAIG